MNETATLILRYALGDAESAVRVDEKAVEDARERLERLVAELAYSKRRAADIRESLGEERPMPGQGGN
jgi:hypothetical protein